MPCKQSFFASKRFGNKAASRQTTQKKWQNGNFFCHATASKIVLLENFLFKLT